MGRKGYLFVVIIVLLVSLSGVAYACVDDSDCALTEICNRGLGVCMGIDDGMIDGYIEITDISSSVCSGELVDITVEGVYPIDYFWADTSGIWNYLAGFNPWTTDCMTSYSYSNYNLYDQGASYNLRFFLVENDPPDFYDYGTGDDVIREELVTVQTSIGIDDAGSGSCVIVPFQHTFKDVDLTSFFGESLEGNNLEIWAAVNGLPLDQLRHSTDIVSPAGEADSWKSSEYGVSLDIIPPPTPSPNADPSTWTMITTPNIMGYSVIDTERGVDYYEYKIDGGSWNNIGQATNFNLPSQADGIHRVYVRASDGCNVGSEGYVDVFIDSDLDCECSSGACCDGCYYEASGSRCNELELSQWECRSGTDLGDDVYVRTRYQECAGNVDTCSGTYNYGWEVDDECGPSEYCASNGDSSCTSCSTQCDNVCSDSKCYGVDPDCTSSGGATQCTSAGGSCSAGSCVGTDCGYAAAPCVDSSGCLRPADTYVCDNTATYNYECINGNMANDDVYRARYLKLCSGDSSGCDGPYAWGSFNQHEECTTAGRCANDGDTSCTAVGTETCDGTDEDWDGTVDDLTGSLCTLQDGVCANSKEMCVGGSWQSCGAAIYGSNYESTETRCDNLDNDCDGNTDESLSRSCGVTNTGVCTLGTENCGSGIWGVCDAILPTTETCDGTDQDCDGILDGSEGFGKMQCYEVADSDYAGVGRCSNGYYACTDSGWDTDCVGDVAPITEECTNGIDDDCDGYVDLNDDDCRCNSDIECNSDDWQGSLSCNTDDVWQDYRDHSCVNPGANDSYCNYVDVYQMKTDCAEMCDNGSCVEYICETDLECGTPNWNGIVSCNAEDVWQNWRDHSCINPATNSSYCNYTDTYQLNLDCAETCDNGSCVDFNCHDDSDCLADYWIGTESCNTDDVWGDYRDYSCVNANSSASYCDYVDVYQMKTDCAEMCDNGSCVDFKCHDDSECNAGWWVGARSCEGYDIKDIYWEYSCVDANSSSSYCNLSNSLKVNESCEIGCNSTTNECIDKGYLWGANFGLDKIYKMDLKGNVLTDFNTQDRPYGLTFDGNYIWSTDWGLDRLYQHTNEGVFVDWHNTETEPSGLTWDGTNLWLADFIGDDIQNIETNGLFVSI